MNPAFFNLKINSGSSPGKSDSLKPYEAFINIGKGGRDLPAIAEGFGRLLSLSFKAGVPINKIVEQLEGISGETQTGFGADKIFSLPDAIAKGIKEAYVRLGKEELQEKIEENLKEFESSRNSVRESGNLCPECGSTLIQSEGCQKCEWCGYSKC